MLSSGSCFLRSTTRSCSGKEFTTRRPGSSKSLRLKRL